MAIIATDTGGGGDFKKVPPGNHVGICNAVVDLGRQRVQSQLYGESVKHQVYIRWELPQEIIEWTDKDGNQRTGPMTIGKTYTVSLHENATLRADLENWRGRAFTREELAGFDIATIAGVAALVNVTHAESGGKTYANVTGVTPLPKGMEKPTASDSPIVYDNEHSQSFDLLPEWLQKKVNEQVVDEKPQPQGSADLNDDIPF